MDKKGKGFLLLDQNGALSVAAALALVGFLGFAALALDIGHMLAVRNELQRVTDAGALAGARALWPNSFPIPSATLPNCANAQSAALCTATSGNNLVDGACLPNANVQVQTGKWDYSTQTFAPGANPVNGVKVTASSLATLAFGGLLGLNAVTVSTSSTAVMDFAVSSGQTALPVAINQPSVVAGQTLFIDFSSTGNGGWFTMPPASASSSVLCGYIDNGSIPPLSIGATINLANGENTTVLQDIQNHLSQFNGSWNTFLPVVNASTFNGSQAVTGFVPFQVTGVTTTGNTKGVTGTVLGLNEASQAQPGGTNFGVLAPVKLVN